MDRVRMFLFFIFFFMVHMHCSEPTQHFCYSEHLDELIRAGAHGVQKRHRDEFVDWFERRVRT